MEMNKPLESSKIFVGGSGLFLQYYDIIKPIFLYAVISMMMDGNNYGLPINIISHMSVPSVIEWYKSRRYINPLYVLDYDNHFSNEYLDDALSSLLEDESIYRVSPLLNIASIIPIYHQQHMAFPIYIYTKGYSKYVENDIHKVFRSIPHYYVYGDLQEATKVCRENFTYIFSDVELFANAADVLINTFSHVLVARDYRYNYIGSNMKYDVAKVMSSHPFLRTGTTTALDYPIIKDSFSNIIV